MHPHLRLHLIILVWGCTAVLGNLISVAAVEVVFFRCLIAVIALAIWIRWEDPSHRWAPKHSRRVILQWLGIGVIIGLHWMLFFAAINVSNVSIAMVGVTTSPLWSAIVDPMIRRRPFRPRQIGFGAVMLVGVCFVFQTSPSQFELGLILAVTAGLVAAVFTSLNVGYTRQYAPKQMTLVQMSGAAMLCFACLPVAAILGTGEKPIAWPANWDWVWIAILSLVCTVYAFTESIDLLKYLSPFTIIFANNLEPVYGIALGAILFQDYEMLDLNFYLGASIIIGSIMTQTWFVTNDE